MSATTPPRPPVTDEARRHRAEVAAIRSRLDDVQLHLIAVELSSIQLQLALARVQHERRRWWQ